MKYLSLKSVLFGFGILTFPFATQSLAQEFDPCDNNRSEVNRRFFDAIRDDDVISLAKLIKCKGITANTREAVNGGIHPLIAAAQTNAIRAVALLMSQPEISLHADWQPPMRQTAFALAVDDGHFEISRLIAKDSRFNPDLPQFTGTSYDGPATAVGAVLESRSGIDSETLQFLLQRKDVDINALQSHPIILSAIYSKQEQFALDILQHKKFRFPRSLSGRLLYGSLEQLRILEALVRRPETRMNAPTIHGFPALVTASWGAGDTYKHPRELSEVIRLFASRADTNVNAIESYTGMSSLHILSEQGFEKSVRILLERKDLNVNIRNRHSKTPLMTAIAKGALNVVQALNSRADLNVNLKDKNGVTALILAVQTPSAGLPIVNELLTKKGINVDLTDNKGKSALQYACENSLPDIEAALIAAGAQDKQCKSPGR